MGAREPKIYMQRLNKLQRGLKIKMTKNNTGNEAETKIVMEWYPIQAILE